MQQYRTLTLQTNPELRSQFAPFHTASWPTYLMQGEVAARYFGQLYVDFAAFQVLLQDADGQVVGCAHSIPLVWDGTPGDLPPGWDETLERGCLDHRAGRRPNTLSALAAMLLPEKKGEGLSRLLLEAMKQAGADAGLTAMLAPVRPVWKHRYPLTPIERYAAWQRPDGAPFDPWLRTHWRMGATFLKVAPESPVITGTVAQWETWTNMQLPESGLYLPPGAPAPLEIDRERDRGRLAEPNVWMLHPIDPA